MNASNPTNPTAPGDVVVAMRDVTVVYQTEGRPPVHALGPIDLDIRAGEVVSLIGPSGCGKSTLLNVAAGLHRPSSGHVTVAGHQVTGPRPDVTAMVFQDYGLFPWFTVLRNVEVALEFQGVPASERRDRAIEQLRKVGLQDFLHALPKHLSGGMRQRVGIARALSLRTPVIMMDEPFGALDEQTRTVLGEELSVLLANEGKTILLVTHSLAEAVFLSNRIVVMSARPGSIKTILEVPGDHPRNPEFMTTPEFHTLRDELFDLMHAEMRASVLSERPA